MRCQKDEEEDTEVVKLCTGACYEDAVEEMEEAGEEG